MLVLQLISERDAYGYELVVRLREAGFADIAEGTVYPALARCERATWVDSYLVPSGKGPARKYYRITDAGRVEYARLRTSWASLTTLITALMKGTTP